MRFCTTCGRNFETSIDICPHDGTPLFGMAGEEDNTAQVDLAAEVSSALAGNEREASSLDASSEELPVESEVASIDLPDDDVAAEAEAEEDLFGGPLVDPPEEVVSDTGLDDASDPFGISAEVVDTPSDDLFAEDGEPSDAEDDFFSESESSGLDAEDLFGEPLESPGAGQEDSDVSQQIAASIDGLLDEIDEDEGEQPLSMSSSLGEEEPAVVDEPYQEEYTAKKGSKMPLFIVLILILSSAVGVYFFMSGSMTNGVKPDQDTPAVVAPKPPPVEEPATEAAAVVEEEAAQEESAAVEEAAVEEAAAEEQVLAEEPAAVPVKEQPAPKPVVAKERPAPQPKAVSRPAARPAAPKKPTAAKELTAEELLEQELKRMAP